MKATAKNWPIITFKEISQFFIPYKVRFELSFWVPGDQVQSPWLSDTVFHRSLWWNGHPFWLKSLQQRPFTLGQSVHFNDLTIWFPLVFGHELPIFVWYNYNSRSRRQFYQTASNGQRSYLEFNYWVAFFF